MQQTKDKQIALILGEIKNDIEKFKIVLNDKDKQLLDLAKLLKTAKKEYQKAVKKKKKKKPLRKFIIRIRIKRRI